MLQDHVRSAPRDGIVEVFEEELDAPVSEVFRGFDWRPVAAASIGQVYRAQLPDGSPVVVKVQRPGIDESVRVDLSVREELDYRIEARNAHAIAATMPDDARIRVPFVYDDLSTSRVLVMEWLDGVS